MVFVCVWEIMPLSRGCAPVQCCCIKIAPPTVAFVVGAMVLSTENEIVWEAMVAAGGYSAPIHAQRCDNGDCRDSAQICLYRTTGRQRRNVQCCFYHASQRLEDRTAEFIKNWDFDRRCMHFVPGTAHCIQ